VPAPLDLDGLAGALSSTLEDLHKHAAGCAIRACGSGTLRTYRPAWRAYEAWIAGLSRASLAGDLRLLAMYAVYRADRNLSVSSLCVQVTAHWFTSVNLNESSLHLTMVAP